ncbi:MULTISPECIES: hypothetical protein [unclassified Agrococcus]|uniref:hypothetical protein n=1 Tax=unclassified Agrococcus TaxID=2615065 RepID=UPI00360644C9
MRRARATTMLAATALLLVGCADAPQPTTAQPVGIGDAAAESSRDPAGVDARATIDGDAVTVVTSDAEWRLEVLEAGPVDLADLAMFDGASTAEPPAGGAQVGWVCVRATQVAGDPGSWLSDDVRIEVWSSPQGQRFDDLTGFDYEPADGSTDVYQASGNALGEPYDRVCPIFVVPADVDFTTLAFVPNGGEPAVLER